MLVTNRSSYHCDERDDDDLWWSVQHPYALQKEHLPQFLLATPSGVNGKGHSAIGDVYAITLDYDNTVTIEEFQRKYKHLLFLWFTTSSHTPEHHKFRVIVWLEAPVSLAVLTANRAILLDYFPGHDPASVSTWQSFPNKLNEHYAWGMNPGSNYNWEQTVADAERKGIHLRPAHYKKSTERLNCLGQPLGTSRPDLYKMHLDKEIIADLTAIPQHKTGGKRHLPFLRLILKLRDLKVGHDYAYTTDQIRSVILAHTNDEKRHKMLNSILQGRNETH